MAHPDDTSADIGREPRLGRVFVSLADSLVDDYDVIDLLDRLVGYCVELLAVEAAGLMLADSRGRLRAVASSSENADLMELLQLQAEQGPCVECFRTVAPVSVPDLAQAADRWPTFVAAAREHGSFASIHSVPLRLRSEGIGALNLMHPTPGPLTEDNLQLAQAMADVATIAILSERAIHRGEVLAEQLQGALNSRVIIEQAKGALAQYAETSTGAAFEALRRYVRSRNLPLSQVARLITEHQLDPAAIIEHPTRSESP